MKKIISYWFLTFLVVSCQNSRETATLQQKLQPIWQDYFQQDFDDDQIVNVFVATNRLKKTPDFGCNDENFGVDPEQKTSFGVCGVKVSKYHEVGNLSNEKSKSTNQNYQIIDKKNLSSSEFYAELLKSKATPLVFVHGFNVRYNEAVLRASQIAYDLKYQGPIILFSWPSGSKEGFFDEALLNKTYELNAKNVKNSLENFSEFLEGFSKNNQTINLVVHSMGHQLVLDVLAGISQKNNKILINELFLNAPDYEAQAFKLMASDLKKIAKHITVYCSNNDKAMTASKLFNNNIRLGACVNVDKIDVINVSVIDDPALGLGHGYYSSKTILNDMFFRLLGISAEQRLFIAKSQNIKSEKYFIRK